MDQKKQIVFTGDCGCSVDLHDKIAWPTYCGCKKTRVIFMRRGEYDIQMETRILRLDRQGKTLEPLTFQSSFRDTLLKLR